LDAQLEKYPVCAECGERIQDDECYEFDGQLICSECLKDNHRRWTEDYIDD
jgi:formylmethanofuran dehydrogenase subunit E